LYAFGGTQDNKKIARLDGCILTEISWRLRLNEVRDVGHAAVSFDNGQKALICFANGGDSRRTCEVFDGSSSVLTYATASTHRFGGLGLYNNRPTTVGCADAKNYQVETFYSTGWVVLPDHPLRMALHSLVGLDNGSMLMLGGREWGSDNYQTGIWHLNIYQQWNRIGELQMPGYWGSTIYIGRTVYYFEYLNSRIYRIDLDQNEELEAVLELGSTPAGYESPVIFQTDTLHYC